MKTFKSMLAGIILLIFCAAANASVKPAPGKLTKDDVINIYIDAMAHGEVKGLDNVLDDSLHYNIKRGDHVNTLHKDELLDYLNSKPLEPTVTTATTVVRDGNDSTEIRVDFKYAGYTRSDLVTLVYSAGWMITKVVVTYS